MATFVVAYINFFNNELKMEVVIADSKLQAMQKRLFEAAGSLTEEETRDFENYVNSATTEEEVKQKAFDCDSMVDAIEV